ncbi:MAG: YqhA family protein [Bacteroidetes bacterium]|nr:YqhA family protein [Bacteroidota bacterium]
MKSAENKLEIFILYSRWIQAPVYIGLVIASVAYSVHFFAELIHILSDFSTYDQTNFMLAILELIHISMVINLLIVVIIGGYYAFVSKIDQEKTGNQLDFLGKITDSSLKIKLIIFLVSISGVHLPETYINLKGLTTLQVIIKISMHLVFIISALLLAYTDKLQAKSH